MSTPAGGVAAVPDNRPKGRIDDPVQGSTLAHAAICIPVRDEAAELPRLFQALDHLDRGQANLVMPCLLLDGCTDASAALAAAFRATSRHRVFIEAVARGAANAGRARHRAMRLGIAALGDGHGLLLTTDADSAPAPCWLTTMIGALADADIVVGRTVRDDTSPNPLQDRLDLYYDRLFAMRRSLDPVPWEASRTHHQAGGANMGIRASVYEALGGFAPVESGEDARLIDDASRAGYRVRRDADSVVRTSDRRSGRAIGGLAAALRRLDDGDAEAISVAHPQDAAWQYRMQAAARAAHVGGQLDRFAPLIGLASDHVRGVARDCPNAEAFAMRVVPTPPRGMRSVTLAVAERELAALTGERQPA